MSIYEMIGLIIFGIFLIAGVIGVIVKKKKTGRRWIGQGFGEK